MKAENLETPTDALIAATEMVGETKRLMVLMVQNDGTIAVILHGGFPMYEQMGLVDYVKNLLTVEAMESSFVVGEEDE